MTRVRIPSRRVYRWTRDLHLYFGLFISPFVLLFAISVILLNHAYLPWGGDQGEAADTRTIPVSVPDEENSLALAEHVRRQIERQTGISGEIGWITRRQEQGRLSFPLEKPGEKASVRVDLVAGTAEIQRRETGVWDAMVYLHKIPGPHLVDIRGNWIFTRAWGVLADVTTYLLLFLTASGIYLWSVLKAERKAGLILLGSGALSFFVIVLAVVGG